MTTALEDVSANDGFPTKSWPRERNYAHSTATQDRCPIRSVGICDGEPDVAPSQSLRKFAQQSLIRGSAGYRGQVDVEIVGAESACSPDLSIEALAEDYQGCGKRPDLPLHRNPIPMSQKFATNVDHVVGRNIRIHRMVKGLSQAALGEKLGITFQQVQKYEKGTNRVGAGRLFQIAANSW